MALPFNLLSAPQVFHHSAWLSVSITIVGYLDDLLLSQQSPQALANNIAPKHLDLEKVQFDLEPSEGSTGTESAFEALGLNLDTIQFFFPRKNVRLSVPIPRLFSPRVTQLSASA